MERYKNSELWLERAEKTIPLGSQTFSKSRTQYPVGVSPFYISRAKGAHVWDIDGNKYTDLVNALASVTIGYCDKRMNRAIKSQLKSGISFSLPGKLEAEVSEKLTEMIPSAEMVRFGKNGSDATSAAVRLARAYTGRDKILVCGYHGWHDWYIGSTTRNKGVPKAVSDLTISFPYNEITTLKNLISLHKSEIAAIVMEPMNTTFPKEGYLEEIRAISSQEGIVLIFDETITGFRFAKGGAQEFFGVIPDLSTFGKGMANGMPLSAVVGNKEIMLEMENIFYSGTFGGELLSLAAANYVIERYMVEDVPKQLTRSGAQLIAGVEQIISDNDLKEVLKFTGHDSWKFLNWSDFEDINSNDIKTYFMQEMFANSALILNTHNISLSMDSKIIKSIIDAYDNTLSKISLNLKNSQLKKQLKVKPLNPLFKVR